MKKIFGLSMGEKHLAGEGGFSVSNYFYFLILISKLLKMINCGA